MPNFTPETTVFFAQTGVDDNNKTVHDTTAAFVAWARTRMLRSEMTDCSFQRIDQGYEIRVDTTAIDYDMLLLADTVCMSNGSGFGGYWYVGIIDRVVWKNPNCSYVYFHLDWYTSLLGNVDYEETYAYIEREHVVKDWAGDNPEFSNMGVDEGFSTNPDTPIMTRNEPFSFNFQNVMVYTPYDDNAKPNFEGQMEDGLYTAMVQRIMKVDECNQYLQKIAESDEADLGNIVSIVSVPDEFSGGKKTLTRVYQLPWKDHVPSVPNFNNSKCWSGEFCQIKLKSGTGQSISVNPQWFGSNKSTFTLELNMFYNNGDGGCTASLINENQSYKKECYDDFSVSIMGLPQSPWVGNAYAQWKAANMTGFVLSNVAGVIGNVGGLIHGLSRPVGRHETQSQRDWASAGQALNSVTSLVDQVGGIMTTIGNAKTSGTVTGGSNNTDINTAVALNKYGFQIIFYMCQQYIMKSVDNFFDRFGYKVNQLKKLNRKARPKWTFIKCHEVHIMGNHIPTNARRYIQDILCSGVTFWREGITIGDFSDAAGNKG